MGRPGTRGENSGKVNIPLPIKIPQRQRTATHTAMQDTDRSACVLPSQGADWGFAPMTGFAPSTKDIGNGKDCLLPSQGGGWGFVEEAVVATPEPPMLSDQEGEEGQIGKLGSSGGSSKKSGGKKSRKGEKSPAATPQLIEPEVVKESLVTTPTPGSVGNRTSVAIDCSPSGIEELRHRAGERPKSRVPSYGIASDLGECRPPTKHRDNHPVVASAAAMPQRSTGESRRMSRGVMGTNSTQTRQPSRGYGAMHRGFATRGVTPGAYPSSAMGSARGVRRRERKGSTHGEGMTIGCEAFSRSGQRGGTISYM